MHRILRLLAVVLLLHPVAGSPTRSQHRDAAYPASEESQIQSVSSASGPIKGSTFAHLGIDLALGATFILAAGAVAEATLLLLKNKKKIMLSRQKEDILRRLNYIKSHEQSLRKLEAKNILLDIADNHAARISSSFKGKKTFERLKVPKEIHQSLENIFLTGEGASGEEGFEDLKRALSSLLDFE
jgi:hypothetical protein